MKIKLNSANLTYSIPGNKKYKKGVIAEIKETLKPKEPTQRGGSPWGHHRKCRGPSNMSTSNTQSYKQSMSRHSPGCLSLFICRSGSPENKYSTFTTSWIPDLSPHNVRGTQLLSSCLHNQATWKLCPKGTPILPLLWIISSSKTEGVFQSPGNFYFLFVQFCFL